jgi:hypothetical protein
LHAEQNLTEFNLKRSNRGEENYQRKAEKTRNELIDRTVHQYRQFNRQNAKEYKYSRNNIMDYLQVLVYIIDDKANNIN